MSEAVSTKTIISPAKLNLTLHVDCERADGYHDIVSLIQPLSLGDEVSVGVAPGEGISLECSARGVPSDDRNLAWRAAELVLGEASVKRSVSMEIKKNIPVAAGLGGGSSDAAGVLMAVNELIGSPLSNERLGEIALEIGSDVPFFLLGSAAIAKGRGEKLTPVRLPRLDYLLINPGFEVSAKWAYSNLNLTKKADNYILNDSLTSLDSPESVASLLENDLEGAVIKAHPGLSELKTLLKDNGALGALMSGSGPTVFGLFRNAETTERAERAIAAALPETMTVLRAEGM